MLRTSPILLLAALAPTAAAQEPAPSAAPPATGEELAEESLLELDTLVITPTGGPERALDTPFATEVVPREELLRRSYHTLPQALRDVPGVMVQETGYGQGSPYIRGFTGFRTLLLVDGIRLNNSVFRSGPNQYWNTVDPFTIDRLEVVKGPSSVLYGSDAIGGTVNAITRDPFAYGSDAPVAGETIYRVASAANYNIGRVAVSGSAGADTGALLGVTRKDLGDVHGGDDIGEQDNTGYDEWDGDVKVEHFLGDNLRAVIAYQKVDQNDVPRTHKTIYAESFDGTTVGNELRRDLDQDRELGYLQLHATDLDGVVDSWSTSFSWQYQSERRNRTKGDGTPDRQGFDVNTLGLWTRLSSDSPIGELTYGLEYYHDDVDSFLDKFENQTPADDIQGPVADDAQYDIFGIYLQDEIEANEALTLTLGARFDYASANADDVRDPVTDERIGVDDDWENFVGSLRFTYGKQTEAWRVFGGVSEGFRAPNLSDLTRFDSARSDEFEIPSPDLDPEHYTSYELGAKWQDRSLAAQVSFFYTDIRDQILRVPTGNTNADGDSEVTKDNVGDGYVYGIELGGAYALDANWSVFGNSTFIEGKVDTYPTSEPDAEKEYLDRLMPLTVQLGVHWEDPAMGLWAELVGIWADDADKLSPRDESDTQRIPPGGTPDYTVFDVRAGYAVSDAVNLTLAVENITDEDYRIHGSGYNRPGTNVVFSVGVSF